MRQNRDKKRGKKNDEDTTARTPLIAAAKALAPTPILNFFIAPLYVIVTATARAHIEDSNWIIANMQ